MLEIAIAFLGDIPKNEFKEVRNFRSKSFKIRQNFESFQITSKSDNFDWSYSDTALQSMCPKNPTDLQIVVTNIPLDKNWYTRRINDNTIVFTLHEIDEILFFSNIPLHNALLRVIYAHVLVYKKYENRIPTNDQFTDFTHDDTRGCIFDMNGIKSHIRYSCESPKLCDQCVTDLKNAKISVELIESIQHELKRIRKPLYFRILDFVKRHPVLALFVSSMYAIILGVIASYIVGLMTSSG